MTPAENATWQARLDEVERTNGVLISQARTTIRRLKLTHQIAGHPFFVGGVDANGGKVESTVLGGADLWAQLLSPHFDVDDSGNGQFFYDSEKDLVYSRERPGSPAPFLEAVELIIARRADKETLYRSVATATATTTTEETAGRDPMDLINEGLRSESPEVEQVPAPLLGTARGLDLVIQGLSSPN
jgi:hypothetical protein